MLPRIWAPRSPDEGRSQAALVAPVCRNATRWGGDASTAPDVPPEAKPAATRHGLSAQLLLMRLRRLLDDLGLRLPTPPRSVRRQLDERCRPRLHSY